MSILGKKRPDNYEDYVVTVKKTKQSDVDNIDSLKRVDPRRLELAYYTEPVMHAGINLYQSFVEAASFQVFTINKVNQALTERLKKTNFYDTFFHFAPLHLVIFGNAYIDPM